MKKKDGDSTLIVHIPRNIHGDFKAKCYRMDLTQKEVIKRLIALFERGKISEKSVRNSN